MPQVGGRTTERANGNLDNGGGGLFKGGVYI